ncbi:MAG: LysR substrate-binding domain-containing protein [Burkholderiaceae bacterium]
MVRRADRLPPAELLVSFEAAARRLSFTAAATERFVTQSAISRQIRTLEDSLGVPLFERRHRALALTPEGVLLYETCREAFGRLRQTVARLRDPAARNIVTLTTTPGLASLWLIPRLPDFTRRHQGVDVRIDASFEARDLDSGDFDVAVRYGRVGTVPGTQLFAEDVMPVCSPLLLKDSSPPLEKPTDLRHHTLLRTTDARAAAQLEEWDPWLASNGLADLTSAGSIGFSSYDDVISAALLGHGVALGRRPLVDALVDRGQLVTPFRGTVNSPRAYFVLCTTAARERGCVRALEAWLIEQGRQPAPPADSG